jgi:predicted anti-sigma-YlaC factor YlaD
MCDAYREALSARLDGEDLGDGWRPARVRAGALDAAAVDAHLSSCDSCRRWYDDATTITRLARFAGAQAGAGGIPDAVLDATPSPTRARIARGLRLLLAVIGAGQVLLAVAQLTGPMSTSSAAVMHMSHEFAAWNGAIGAAFLFIAWRRTRPAALIPLLTAFVAVLTVLSLDDLVNGEVTTGRLGTHLLVVAGYAVIVALSRPSLTFDSPPGIRERTQPSAWRLEDSDDVPWSVESGRSDREWPDAPDSPAASGEKRAAA